MHYRLTDQMLRYAPRRPATAPLVCFVHVPKAAGSAVTLHLQRWSWRGVGHVERIADTPAAARLLSRCDWISGHLPLKKMQSFLAAAAPSRRPRLFGAMRDCTEQVAAHYNWLIEIYQRGSGFYQTHSPRMQEVSERIRGTDHTKPAEVIAALAATPGLFANQQSRFLLGDGIDPLSPKARRRMALYAGLHKTDNLPGLLRAATGRDVRQVARFNTSRWHFDRAVFHTPELQDFLRQFNAADEALYAQLDAAP